MTPHYHLKIYLRDNDRVPARHSYANYKNELVISERGNIIDICGDSRIMKFKTEKSAIEYARENKARFQKNYGSVEIIVLRQHYPATAAIN